MEPKRGISAKALLLGVLTDIGGSLAVGLTFVMVVGIALVGQGVPPQELQERMQAPSILVPCLIIGVGFALLGGYVAGRIAGRSGALHGGLVGLIDILVGAPFWAAHPLWYNIVATICILPLAALGGRIAVASRPRENVDFEGRVVNSNDVVHGHGARGDSDDGG